MKTLVMQRQVQIDTQTEPRSDAGKQSICAGVLEGGGPTALLEKLLCTG